MELTNADIIRFLDILPEGFIVLNKELRYVYINQGGANLLKRTKENLIGKLITDVFPESITLPFFKKYLQAIQDQQQNDWEEYLTPYNRWFYNYICPFKDGLIVFLKDIHDWKDQQQQLLLANDRFQLVAKATADIIWDWDLVSLKMEWNDNFLINLGYDRSDLTNSILDWDSRIHPADKADAIQSLYDVIASKNNNWSYEYRFRKKNNSYAQIFDRGYVIRNSNGVATRMIGAMMDITERMAAQELATRLAAIIEATTDLVSFGDENNNPVYINQSGLNLLGLSSIEEFRKMPLNSHHPQETLQILRTKALPTAIRNGNWSGESAVQTLDGKTIPVSQVIIAHKTKDGSLHQLSTIIRDISKSKQTERELQNLNSQLRTLGTKLHTIVEEERARLAREIHDDLGQQLVMLKMDLIQYRKYKNEDAVIAEKKLEQAIEQINTSIKTVQRLSLEIHPHLVRDLGLIEAIEWYVLQITERSGIKAIINLDKNINILDINKAVAIFRIIQEALSNVVKHSNATNLTISLKEQKMFYNLVIKDNGKGFILEEKGSFSLGLTGMKERASMIDSKIEIVTSQINGTSITLNIPI